MHDRCVYHGLKDSFSIYSIAFCVKRFRHKSGIISIAYVINDIRLQYLLSTGNTDIFVINASTSFQT